MGKRWFPKVGEFYRYDFGPDHFATRNMEVRAVVDETIVVVRVWSIKHSRWNYESHTIWLFEPGASSHLFKMEEK